jgi:hypothetical protein
MAMRDLSDAHGSGLTSVATNQWQSDLWPKIKKKIPELLSEFEALDITPKDRAFWRQVLG